MDKVEELAIRLYEEKFGRATTPLRTRGGALDPSGWAMKAAYEALSRNNGLEVDTGTLPKDTR